MTHASLKKPKRPIQDRFDEFHEKHPEVFAWFEEFTLELIATGNDRGGARMVIERIRWEVAVNPSRDEDFKINDNFISRYSRLYMDRHAEHRGFFETRKLKSRPQEVDSDE